MSVEPFEVDLLSARFRCSNTDCSTYETFLDPSEVLAIAEFGGALYHAHDGQRSLLAGSSLDPQPLPCGPVMAIAGPCRIRLRRFKGWRKPVGAVAVTRPGRFGNPITMDGDNEAAAEWFGVMLDMRREGTLPPHHAGYLYPTDEEIIDALAGRDLACWCPLDRSCHADVLLAAANTERAARFAPPAQTGGDDRGGVS